MSIVNVLNIDLSMPQKTRSKTRNRQNVLNKLKFIQNSEISQLFSKLSSKDFYKTHLSYYLFGIFFAVILALISFLFKFLIIYLALIIGLSIFLFFYNYLDTILPKTISKNLQNKKPTDFNSLYDIILPLSSFRDKFFAFFVAYISTLLICLIFILSYSLFVIGVNYLFLGASTFIIILAIASIISIKLERTNEIEFYENIFYTGLTFIKRPRDIAKIYTDYKEFIGQIKFIFADYLQIIDKKGFTTNIDWNKIKDISVKVAHEKR